jgi:hypothetical protein
LRRANLNGVVLKKSNYDQHTAWPDGFEPEAKPD